MPEREWLLAGKLLVPHAPQVRLSSRGLGWHAPSGLALEQLPAQRVDGLQAMWNASPQHLLKLVSKAQSTVLLWSLTRALQDQSVYLDQLDVPQVEPLLHKSYAPTAALGLEVVQKRLATLRDMQDMRPWLLALAQCPDGPAATYLSAMLSKALPIYFKIILNEEIIHEGKAQFDFNPTP